MRQEIEAVFSEDIIQRIKIIEERKQQTAPLFSTGLSSFTLSLPEFLTSSSDLTGFGGSVGSTTGTVIRAFSTGIDRVPRDMLAMIHKDETILPINKAEDYRRGGSNASAIQNLNVSFNVPNTINLENLGREQFRNFAFQLMEEIERLNRRIH